MTPNPTPSEEALDRLRLLADGCDVSGLDHLPIVSRANAAAFAADIHHALALLSAKDTRIVELTAALEPFAREAEQWTHERLIGDDWPVACHGLGEGCNHCGEEPGCDKAAFTLADLRRALAASKGVE